MLLLLVLAFAFATTAAEAARFTCKAARDLARLAARDSDYVVVDPDDVRKECRFSVNGEPAGSPPRGAIIASLNVLRAGGAATELGRTDGVNIDWLGLVLLAASGETGISPAFRDTLISSRDLLRDCFARLEGNIAEGPVRFSNNRNVLCGPLPPGGGEIGFGGGSVVEFQSEGRYFTVGAKRGDNASYLFIPFGRFRGPPLQ
jgi:hypothetical protein